MGIKCFLFSSAANSYIIHTQCAYTFYIEKVPNFPIGILSRVMSWKALTKGIQLLVWMKMVKSYYWWCISVMYLFLQVAIYTENKKLCVGKKNSLHYSYVTCCCQCKVGDCSVFPLLRKRRSWPHFHNHD